MMPRKKPTKTTKKDSVTEVVAGTSALKPLPTERPVPLDKCSQKTVVSAPSGVPTANSMDYSAMDTQAAGNNVSLPGSTLPSDTDFSDAESHVSDSAQQELDALLEQKQIILAKAESISAKIEYNNQNPGLANAVENILLKSELTSLYGSYENVERQIADLQTIEFTPVKSKFWRKRGRSSSESDSVKSSCKNVKSNVGNEKSVKTVNAPEKPKVNDVPCSKPNVANNNVTQTQKTVTQTKLAGGKVVADNQSAVRYVEEKKNDAQNPKETFFLTLVDPNVKWTALSKEIMKITNDLEVKLTGGRLQLHSVHEENCNLIQNFLKSKNIQFTSKDTPKKPTLEKFVIKGLPIDMDIEEIKEELTELGLKITKIEQMHNKMKRKIPMYLVTKEKQKDEFNIMSLKYLFMIVIKVEKYRSLVNVIRCFVCQEYGHKSFQCTNQAICALCTGKHQTASCTQKTDDENSKCVHCGEGHAASSKSCPVFLKLKEEQIKKLPPRSTSEKTYAQAVSPPQNTEDPLSKCLNLLTSEKNCVNNVNNVYIMEKIDVLKQIFLLLKNLFEPEQGSDIPKPALH